jgi:hypothetical protein
VLSTSSSLLRLPVSSSPARSSRQYSTDLTDSVSDPHLDLDLDPLTLTSTSASISNMNFRVALAAVGDFSKPATEQAGKVYTEKDWNPITEKECEGLKSDK